MESYRIPASTQRFRLTIKRSEFITTVAAVSNKADVKALLAQIQKELQDARHHCWAHVLGQPGDYTGFNQSDDGEPKGTAGKPMLNVLTHSDIGNIMAVTSRYFGGIKLGAGGLVRAYTQSVSEALKQLDTLDKTVCQNCTFSIPYPLLPIIEHWLNNEALDVVSKDFSAVAQLTIAIPINQQERVTQRLIELSNGQAIFSSPI